MNILQLFVQGQLVEEIHFEFPEGMIIEQRESFVMIRRQYLIGKYWKSLVITPKWEIVLILESKMNNWEEEPLTTITNIILK